MGARSSGWGYGAAVGGEVRGAGAGAAGSRGDATGAPEGVVREPGAPGRAGCGAGMSGRLGVPRGPPRGVLRGPGSGSAGRPTLPVRGAAIWGGGLPLRPELSFWTQIRNPAAAASVSAVHARGRRRCPGAGAEVVGLCACARWAYSGQGGEEPSQWARLWWAEQRFQFSVVAGADMGVGIGNSSAATP